MRQLTRHSARPTNLSFPLPSLPTGDALLSQLALLSASRPTTIPPLPPSTSRAIARLPAQPSNSRLDSRLDRTLPGGAATAASPALDDATELARRYRLTGRSVFWVELRPGMRARAEEAERVGGEGKGKGKEKEKEREADDGEGGQVVAPEFVRKGVAIRLETFCKGQSTLEQQVFVAQNLPS